MARATAWAAWLAITTAGVALVAWTAAADAHWAERHVLPSYCATGLAGQAAAGALRWILCALGAATVFLAPALARRLGRARQRPRAALLTGLALAVAASLGVAEAYMRRLQDRLTLGAEPSLAGAREVPMTRADPRLGWAYFPGRTTWVELGGRRISYAIDAHGERARSQGDLRDPDRPTLLFAGESIAFGYGLPYEETFPFLVGRDLGLQTANLAVVGYGNDQAYLRVLDALERYRRPLAVVTLFHPGQIRRNADTWRTRLALGPGGALRIVPPSTAPRVAKLLEVLPFHGDGALRVTAATLRATADAARARGAVALFVVTNYGPACLHEEGAEPWIVDELFRSQGLPFVRVELGPDDLLPGLFERHPSLRGTRKIAAAVERALADQLASPASSPAAPSRPAPRIRAPSGESRRGGIRLSAGARARPRAG